jgi:hypothetical protein
MTYSGGSKDFSRFSEGQFSFSDQGYKMSMASEDVLEVKNSSGEHVGKITLDTGALYKQLQDRSIDSVAVSFVYIASKEEPKKCLITMHKDIETLRRIATCSEGEKEESHMELMTFIANAGVIDFAMRNAFETLQAGIASSGHVNDLTTTECGAAAMPVPEEMIPPPSVPSRPLKDQATTFGNKTANLERLQRLFTEDPHVVIPLFRGIQHRDILEHITTSFPDFLPLWEEFKHVIGSPPEISRGTEVLLQIQAGIASCFKDFDHEAIEAMMTRREKLMVRSTGHEDTKELANAGGNESVANVAPSKDDIKEAIGRVIASYFGMKSLRQRFESGDDITQDPFMPVLLQVMIGEKPTGEEAKERHEIPTSGVMYTTEGELNTKGVVQIAAAFGHAEGVVTGEQASDIYYVQDTHIHQIVSTKEKRFVPQSAGALALEENPMEMKNIPALSPKMLRRIAAIGQRIEKEYGFPVDVEWTHDPMTDKVYLLQARPLPDKGKKEPSYLEPKKFRDLHDLQRIHVVGAAGGELKVLTRENTIVAHSATEALEYFLDMKGHKPECIVINVGTASNSHEAGFFRERGIPILHAPGETFSHFSDMIKDGSLFADVQEGVVASVPEGKDPSEYIVTGLRRHMVPSMESGVVEERDYAAFVEEINALAKGVEIEKVLGETYGWNNIDILLNAFEEREDEKLRAAIMTRMITITMNITKKVTETTPEHQRALLLNKVMYDAQHVWETFASPDADEIQKKYAMNWLRAALLQESSPGIWDGDTLYSIMGEEKERENLKITAVPGKGEIKEYTDIFMRCKKFMLGDYGKVAWERFIPELSDTEKKAFATLLSRLGPKAVEVFLNTTFLYIWTESGREPHQCMKDLIAKMSTSKCKEVLELVSAADDIAKKYEGCVQDFGDPTKFEYLLKALHEELFEVGMACVLTMRDVTGFESALMSTAFARVVSAFDNCIKALTASARYEGHEQLKVERFAEILEHYLTLTVEAMDERNIEGKSLQKQAAKLQDYMRGRYEELTGNLGDSQSHKDSLLHTKGFSVAAAALGSNNMRPDRTPPMTLEDLFTQMHQSLETVIAVNMIRSDFHIENLPPIVGELAEKIHEINLFDIERLFTPPTLQSIEYSYPHVKVTYNAPLVNHSAKFSVEAVLSGKGDVKEMNFVAEFFAADGGLRANRDALLRIYGLSTGMKTPEDYRVQNQGAAVCLKWKCSPEDVEDFWCEAEDHVQRMVNFLQMKDMKERARLRRRIEGMPEGRTKLKLEKELAAIKNEELEFSDMDLSFLEEYPWVMRDFFKKCGSIIAWEHMTEAQHEQAVEAFLTGIGDEREEYRDILMRLGIPEG